MAWTCLLCQQNSFEKVALHVRDSYNHGVVKCATCGHVQLNPVPSEEELTEYYRNETQRRSVHGHMTREQKRLHVKADTDRRVALVKYVKQWGAGFRLYDIGSGQGFVVDEIEKMGWSVNWKDVDLENMGGHKDYDFVTLFHVLEHVIAPVNFILTHWEKVTEDYGHLIIEVPNHDDWLISACHEYRAWNYQRAHIHYFTPRTLLSVVNQSGIQYRNLKLFGVQRYSRWVAAHWEKGTRPNMRLPIGYVPDGTIDRDKEYRQLHESTLTSDTLCLILQK